MHFQTAATAALLGSLVSAGPLDTRATKKTFTVKQVAVKQMSLPPALQVLRTYQKYMKDPPRQVQVAAKVAQSGSVVANPQSYDLAYLSQVTVGGQTFNLNFDTGSADLWVYSSLQPSSQRSGRTVYDPSKSNTSSVLSSQAWKITYGDGSGASGKVYADKVVIGGVTATSQAVEAATSVSQQFLNDAQSGGLVGLSFSNLNTVRPNQQVTFFDSVKSSLAAPLFTANLKKGAPGSYDFGYIDASKYSGAITYAPVQYWSGWWQFAMGGYTIGGKAANTDAMGNGIADTGTTLLYLPDAVVSDYWNAVSGASFSSQFGAYIFPCASNLPTFAISIQGRNFVIPGNYMNYAPISNTMCFGGLQSNSGIGFSILGDVFLKSVFAIFDASQATPRIGFAKQAGDSDDDDLPIDNSTLPIVATSDATSLFSTTTVDSSSPSTTTTATTTIVSLSSTTPLTSSSASKANNAPPTTTAKKTTTTTTARKTTTTTAKKTTTTTTRKTTTTTRKTTTTRQVIKKTRTTTKRRASFLKKYASCNQKYIAAIMKKAPLQPIKFCRNYRLARNNKSSVSGIPSSAAVVKACKCFLNSQ